MQQLSTVADVAAASASDPQCIWAAQGLDAGGLAFEHGGAVAVGCPALAGRDRLVVRGPAAPAARLVRAAVDALGPSYTPIGDPDVMATALDELRWLEQCDYFGWMDGTHRPQHKPVHTVRWLSRREWQAVDELLDVALPSGYTRPGAPGVRRWAGVKTESGRLTCAAADAWSAPGVGFLGGHAVAPEARRSGQGRDVCAFLLTALIAAHGRAAVMVRAWNTDAITLYAQLGLRYRLQRRLRVRRPEPGSAL